MKRADGGALAWAVVTMVILILAMMLLGSGAAAVGSVPLALGLFGLFAAAHVVSLLVVMLSAPLRTRVGVKSSALRAGETRRTPGGPRASNPDYVTAPRSSEAAL